MHLEESAVGPSRLAVWLITLFGPGEQGQAALADLLEEFLLVRRQLGLPAAKRWFWGQTLTTVVYLIGSELRSAPFTVATGAIGGFLLRWYVSRLSYPTVNIAIDALLHRYRVFRVSRIRLLDHSHHVR